MDIFILLLLRDRYPNVTVAITRTQVTELQFGKDFEDARKCQKEKDRRGRPVLRVTLAWYWVGKNIERRSGLVAKRNTLGRTIPPSKLPRRTMLLPSKLANHFQSWTFLKRCHLDTHQRTMDRYLRIRAGFAGLPTRGRVDMKQRSRLHSKPSSSNHLPISFQLASNFHWKKIGSFGRELEVFSKLELELEDFEQLEEIRNRLWNLKCRSSPNQSNICKNTN